MDRLELSVIHWGGGSLRPMIKTLAEILEGPSAFVPALWRTACLPAGDRTRIWAIPWLADVRVIFYWRDMLEQAGIDEETAFETPEQLAETMARLQANRSPSPWGIWSSDRLTTLQNAASWIWEAGGSFASSDGRQIMFNQPEARQGLFSYLDLVRRYTSPTVTQLSHNTISLFAERQAAVAMGPCQWLMAIQSSVEDIEAKLGIAAPPGPAFVDGDYPSPYKAGSSFS